MTKEKMVAMVQELESLGYKKYTTAKHSDKTEFEMMKSSDDGKYIIIYRFWNFEQFVPTTRNPYSVDIVFLIDDHFQRIDVQLTSAHKSYAEIEQMAKESSELVDRWKKR